ncbi:MAG TPA: hypothetical protein VHR41_09750 [Gemmatimonadales bacterium]|jgi:hypothetical protein|nr:hypothetical protein [Gemmatimonadales bacterium]
MPRTLTVSRVRVRTGSEEVYLAGVRELAALAETRGWHLWVFRRPDDPQLFLECSESANRETHRAFAERPADERRIEQRLRSVATYEPGAWDLWEEVRSSD